ncbi:MAG TPA: tetratricopeptide repeat protein [Bryobacteraceae bacterium]|nr:tetratricopeptide repeat protein [Bryobacteraceae bacterium]
MVTRAGVGRVVFILALALPFSFPALADSAVAEITAAIRTGQFAQARDLAAAALKTSPGDPRLWTLAGIADEKLGDATRALADYRGALKTNPRYIPALKGAAGIEYRTGSPDTQQTLEGILAQQPADETAHAMLAALAFRRHDCSAVRTHYAAAPHAIRSEPAALTQYAQCLLENHQTREAIEALEQASQLRAGDPVARYNLALAQYLAGDHTAALSTLAPLLQNPNPEPRVLDLASAAYEASGDTPKSVDLLHRAIVAQPDNALLYLHFVDLCFTHRSFQTGIDMVTAGIQRLPRSAKLYAARGILWAQLGKYDNADADFRQAEQLDPRQGFSSLAQGVSDLQSAHFDQALATTEAQIRKTPNDPFLYYLKAQALYSKGVEPGTPAIRQAIDAAEHAIRLRPNFPVAQNLLATLYRKSGEPERARKLLESVLAANPNDQTALYQLSQLEKAAGRIEQSRALLKRLGQAKINAQEEAAKASRYQLVESQAAPSY